MKQKLKIATGRNGYIMTVENFNTSLLIIEMSNRQKISKDIEYLNYS